MVSSQLLVDSKYDNDTILFSIIGYKPLLIKISDLRINVIMRYFLKKEAYENN
jgi:hypothetical protein